ERSDVVHLARVHDSNVRVAHDDDVKIRCGQRRGQFLQGLIGDSDDAVEVVLLGKRTYGPELAATADEAERDVAALLQPPCRVEQGRQRMTRAVIARVHDDMLLLEAERLAKPLAAARIVSNVVILGPGWQN